MKFLLRFFYEPVRWLRRACSRKQLKRLMLLVVVIIGIKLLYDLLIDDPLADVLNRYRQFYLRNKLRDAKFGRNRSANQLDIDSDVLFHSDLFIDRNPSAMAKLKRRFYMPDLLIDNKNACKQRTLSDNATARSSATDQQIFILFLIHSHTNNYMRRKTLRHTWLSMNKIDLVDLLLYSSIQSPDLDLDNRKRLLAQLRKKHGDHLNIAHLFFVGKDRNEPRQLYQNSSSMKALRWESRLYGDIVMIDTFESYENIIYKHLTLVDWAAKNCPRATYVIKIDDDVFVNMKSLTMHLLTKFSSVDVSRNYKFMYCNKMAMATPRRDSGSKWRISYEMYPFFFFPNYCGGFAYITNIATIKVMQEQSQIIPRFWIDDAYVTGFLLHALKDIEWFHFKYSLSWSFYNFWNMLDHSTLLSNLYNFLISLLYMNANDLFLYEYFVVLHVHLEHSQFDYRHLNMSGTRSVDLVRNMGQFKYAKPETKSLCFEANGHGSMSQSTARQRIRCFSFENDFFSYYYYIFSHKLWNKVSSIKYL